jgi:hypothetical protein
MVRFFKKIFFRKIYENKRSSIILFFYVLPLSFTAFMKWLYLNLYKIIIIKLFHNSDCIYAVEDIKTNDDNLTL